MGSYFGRLTERESDTSDTAIQLDQLPIAKSCSKCVFLVPFDRKSDLDGESAVDGLDPNVHRNSTDLLIVKARRRFATLGER